MADVFVAFTTMDRIRVDAFVRALEGRGFSLWVEGGAANGAVSSNAERELRMAKAVVVAWTPGAVAAPVLCEQAAWARDKGRLVQVLLEPVEAPLGFGAFQAFDLSRWNGEPDAPPLQALDEALRAKIGDRSEARPASRPMLTPFRIGAAAIVVAAAVIALVLGAAAVMDPLAQQQTAQEQGAVHAPAREKAN